MGHGSIVEEYENDISFQAHLVFIVFLILTSKFLSTAI